MTPRLTSLDSEGWELDDGEVAHAQAPGSYWIPEEHARRSLKVGQFAKLRFYIRTESEAGDVTDNGERMWVEVKGVVGEWYRGELANQPCCTDGIAPGLEVWFQPRHVIDIHAEGGG